jgi:hypothetical protein
MLRGLGWRYIDVKGWALKYNSDTRPQTVVYGTKSGAVYQWQSIAVAF